MEARIEQNISMKVLIVNNMAPFIWGGAEELALHLKRNLILAGHQAEILRIPFQWEPATIIPSQMLLARTLELWNVDRVIALKFPAYLIRHSNKVLWLLHQYRQNYDLYDQGVTNIPKTKEGDELRSLITNADNQAFQEVKKIFTNSPVVSERLKRYNNFDSEVLYPPLNDAELFRGRKSEGYIFAGGRINSMKRQFLLIEALMKTSSQCKLIIAGPPETDKDKVQLENFVQQNGLSERVKLDFGFHSREKIANYVNGALACAYIPFNEDSLGYVSMEGAAAGKALITTSDSGGVLGLVHHKETGWVADPTVESLAHCFEQAYKKPRYTAELGKNAHKVWGGV